MASLDAKPAAAGANRILSTTNAAAQQVIAYCFHGTVRCETCLLIEKLANILVEQQFSAELDLNWLVFMAVDYELPENTHFLTDYKLPCPSLVLVKRGAGEVDNWKLLGDTWQLINEPVNFSAYVEAEVRNVLYGAKPPAGTNPCALPPALKDH